MSEFKSSDFRNLISTPVIVGTLGFFVDSFDLVLYNLLKTPSLESLGFYGHDNIKPAVLLLNFQMVGFFIGGFIWGIIADKIGRAYSLLGSILLYSSACLVNAFIDQVWTYAVCRLVAGVGMAGELGIAMTFVVESVPKSVRGYCTMIVSVVGTLGAVAASALANILTWRQMYFTGGALGMMLLFFRYNLKDSVAFKHAKKSTAPRGDIFLILRSGKRLFKFLKCIMLGVPAWFGFGIFLTFSDDITRARGFDIKTSTLTSVCLIVFVMGDFVLAALSQFFKTRKKVLIGTFLFAIPVLIYTLLYTKSEFMFYVSACMLLALLNPWAVFMTTTSEHFGTNIRGTVTTLAPNCVRAFLILLTTFYKELTPKYFSAEYSVAIIGVFVLTISLTAALTLRESGHHDIDFIEEYKKKA